MGIFSKFQIKDIKTKILGGKVKHKGDVPSIAVSPPTPSVHEDFTFPEDQIDRVDNSVDLGDKNIERHTFTRQRSSSLPEVFDDAIVADFQLENKNIDIVKSFLKLPKPARKKRRRGRRAISCPDNLSEISGSVDAEANGRTSKDIAGPNDHADGDYGDKTDDIVMSVSPQLGSENKEFGTKYSIIKDDNNRPGISCHVEIGLDNEIFRHDSIGSTVSSHNGVINCMDASPSAEEFQALSIDSDEQSEKSETSSNTTNSRQTVLRRIFSVADRRKPEARWSLDLEKLGTGCSDNSLLSEDGEMKWDGKQPRSPQEKNNLASTWSLDLNKGMKVDHDIGRAYSEINFSGSPNLRDVCDSGFSEKVMFNAKSLDLEFVKQETGNTAENPDSTVEQPVLKRGISGYVGKFNGFVSKFSTWSLDIELARKRSLEKELDSATRAQSELSLGAYKAEPSKGERAVSYHSLLYDFEEASRYQIYQPTVYEIEDENLSQSTEKTAHQNHKSGTYGNSMKFLSKQFEHIYENGKSLYKHRHVIIDAIKQRERELKAIADKEAKAKLGQGADNEKHTFFKPKPPQRRRTAPHKKHVHKVQAVHGKRDKGDL